MPTFRFAVAVAVFALGLLGGPRQAAPALADLLFQLRWVSLAPTQFDPDHGVYPNQDSVSTDLGVSYYYTNQPDKALEQFNHSLQLDPKHAKTLLNVGIVKAFGKQDLAGASEAWQQVIKIAPDSPEGQAAKRALDSLQSAHPGMGAAQKPSG